MASNFCVIYQIRFLSSPLLFHLVRSLGKTDLKYQSQEFDSKVLDLVNQTIFDPYESLSDFVKFKEKLIIKQKFLSKKNGDNEYEFILNV